MAGGRVWAQELGKMRAKRPAPCPQQKDSKIDGLDKLIFDNFYVNIAEELVQPWRKKNPRRQTKSFGAGAKEQQRGRDDAATKKI